MRGFHRTFQPIEYDQRQVGDSVVDWGSQEWGTHRFHVRQLLEHAIDSLSIRDKAVVLGAGNHGDVDLPELANQFTQVTVMDTEANAIEEVLEQSGGVASTKVKSLTHIDYTCLDQIQFYETWEDLLINHAPAHEIYSYLKNCSFEVRKYEALPHLKKSFSLVISSSVHTQLFYINALTQFSVYVSQYNSQEIGQIIEGLMYLRNSLITDYNRLLVSLLKPEGKLVMWSEMIRLNEQNQIVLDNLHALHTEKERMAFLFRSFGEMGMEVAVLGLKGLYDQMKPEGQLFKSWFNLAGDEKQYLTAGFSGAVRK
ncbi:hypothetical protein [Paenibacillus agricola]|uniref:Class I SAM-dependent methyltransferase n=1 Tax=Paenibacillus agricola TaxID=2716264 RepID=A0ABX0IX74_9BACL|nr:hypothetical protein [Paenibacillus agricola]NHN28537.1 hypothetical protein [Paenibacillus agricola]